MLIAVVVIQVMITYFFLLKVSHVLAVIPSNIMQQHHQIMLNQIFQQTVMTAIA